MVDFWGNYLWSIIRKHLKAKQFIKEEEWAIKHFLMLKQTYQVIMMIIASIIILLWHFQLTKVTISGSSVESSGLVISINILLFHSPCKMHLINHYRLNMLVVLYILCININVCYYVIGVLSSSGQRHKKTYLSLEEKTFQNFGTSLKST